MYTIYSKTGCPFCTKLEQVMKLCKLDHTIHLLGVDFTREEFYSKFGEGSTFPQVILDGRNLGGCQDTIQYINENNLIK